MVNAFTSRRVFLQRGAQWAAVAGLTGVGSLLDVVNAASDGAARIRMQLGWLASNGLLGEVVARHKGYYRDRGIELEIVPGGPNVDGVAGVASGQSTLGQLTSSPSLMLARSAGMPVKAIAAGYQKHPFAYYSRRGNPIAHPRDFVGKRVATQPISVVLLRALLRKNGIPEDKVTIVNMGSDMNQLITGQADAVSGWLTNVNALKVLGDDRVDFMLWDGGIQLYANVYYTTDKQLKENADALARFLAGSALGWQYARDNQEEAVDLLVKAYPNLDRRSELEAIGPLMKFVFNDTTAQHGWGAMNRDNWAAQIQSYAELGQFKGTVPAVDDVVSMAILDATADVRKQAGK